MRSTPQNDWTPSNENTKHIAVPRLALSVAEAAGCLGVSERTMHDLLNAGILPSVKVGTRRLVPITSLAERLAELADAGGVEEWKSRRAGQSTGGRNDNAIDSRGKDKAR